jgi:hypothetical protein
MSKPISDADMALLRELAAKATPRPWSPDVYYIVGQVPKGRPGGEVIGVFRPTAHIRTPDKANAELAVAAVNALPGLLVRLALAEALAEPLAIWCSGDHDQGCRSWRSEAPCDCGMEAGLRALAAWRAGRGGR